MTKIIAAKPADAEVVLRRLTVVVNGAETVFEKEPSEIVLGEILLNSEDVVVIDFNDVDSNSDIIISHRLQFKVDGEPSEIIIPE